MANTIHPTALYGTSTVVDDIFAAFYCACDTGDIVAAGRLFATLEGVLRRRMTDGHHEVEKLCAQLPIAKEALQAMQQPSPTTLKGEADRKV